MRSNVLRLSGCGLVALALVAAPARGDEKEKPAAKPDAAAMEKMMEEWAAPAPEHAVLKHLVGDWKASVKCFMEGAEEPMVSEGEATFKLLLGGRFVHQKFRATMNGKPFEGLGVTGYDKSKKKYVSTWIDNMGTGMMTTEGEYDADAKTMTETGTSNCPLGEMKMRMVSKSVDDDTFTLSMYATPVGGKETKAMEITYTRKK